MAIDPTTAAGFIPSLWDSKVQYASNKRRGVTRMVDDTGKRWFGPGGTIKRPIMQVWPAALTYSGAALTIQNPAQNIGTADITPTWKYAHTTLQEDAANTGIVDLVQVYAPAIVESVYQAIDIDVLTLIQSAVASVGGAAEWNESDFLSAISTLLTNGGDKVELGNIFGVYHTAKWDAIFGTGNIVSAAIRGENNSGAKTGMVQMAYGVKLFFTALVTTSTTLRNAIFVRDAIWIARKNDAKFEMGRNVTGNATVGGLTTSLACSTGYGTAYLHKSTTPQFSSDLLVAHLTNTA